MVLRITNWIYSKIKDTINPELAIKISNFSKIFFGLVKSKIEIAIIDKKNPAPKRAIGIPKIVEYELVSTVSHPFVTVQGGIEF